jgi:hypothetical protein
MRRQARPRRLRKVLRRSPNFPRPSRTLWPRPSGLEIGTEKDWDQSFAGDVANKPTYQGSENRK